MMKALIVDDELTSRMKMFVVLSSLGEILQAKNGKQAIELFIKAYQEENPFDLITLDIGMNDLSGVEVLASMRQYEEKLPIKNQSKIIMVTSHSDRPIVIDSFLSGCNDFIIKPFHKRTVFEKLDQIARKTNNPKFFVTKKNENQTDDKTKSNKPFVFNNQIEETFEGTNITSKSPKMTEIDENFLTQPEREIQYISYSEEDHSLSNFLFENQENVFDILYIDNYTYQFIKIKDEHGKWLRPHLIEIFDKGSKYIFTMESYLSSNHQTSIDLLSKLISKSQLPKQKIRLCTNCVTDYFHLKQPISDLNEEYMTPGGFHLDLVGPNDTISGNKVNLKSDFQILHALEKNIIKEFGDKIVKEEFIPSINNERSTTVTFLNIGLEDIRKSQLMETYRNIHNTTEISPNLFKDSHIQPWIPNEKLQKYMSVKEKMIFNFDAIMKSRFNYE